MCVCVCVCVLQNVYIIRLLYQPFKYEEQTALFKDPVRSSVAA